MSSPGVRIRGVYATALTHLLANDGLRIVDASATIEERVTETVEPGYPDVRVDGTDDREGVRLIGTLDGVERVIGGLTRLARDTIDCTATYTPGTVHTGRVSRAEESGAIVDIGDDTGFLPYSHAERFIDEDDPVTVQLLDPEPPWSVFRRPVLTMVPRVPGMYLDLVAGAPSRDTPQLDDAVSDALELIDPDLPSGWHVEAKPGATRADIAVLDEEVDRLLAAQPSIERRWNQTNPSDDGTDPQYHLAWCWIGRESRFALDEHRGAVTRTVDGHHRIKASHDRAGLAVDFLERLDAADVTFDATAVFDVFGPAVGDRLSILHGKPDGSAVSLGRAEVVERPKDGAVTVKRSLSGGGTLDALDVPKADGDTAETTFVEGAWWYPTVYRDREGTWKGTYVNVGTPIEIFPDRIRYVDLYVDVIRTPDGEMAVVDEDELADAVSDEQVSTDLADRARTVAAAVERSFG